MKRNKLLSIIIAMALMMTLILSSCNSAPKTLEDYVNSDEEVAQEIQELSDESGLTVNVSGNDVTYTCELTDISSDLTEDIVKSDVMIDSLKTSLESTSSTFSDMCKELEEESELENIQIIVIYTFNSEELIKMTFNKDGVVE